MNNYSYLTPTGCGPSRGDCPEYPVDLIPRLKHLEAGPEALFLAWEITRLAGRHISPEKRRALVLLVLALQVASAGGSTRLPLSSGGQLERILEDLETTADERAAMEELLGELQSGSPFPGLADLCGGPGDYRPLIIDRGCLYMQKLHVLEGRTGALLRERISGGSEGAAPGGAPAGEALDAAVERALLDVFSHPPVTAFGKVELDEEQKRAVRAALRGRIAVISGRPGSGKTSIVASLLRVLARVGRPPLEAVALAAPTGKAADRMRQSIAGHLAAIPNPGAADRRLAEACPPALTLHRLLGYSPAADRFWHNENNPLAEQLIIVDESSMVDLAMMDRLLRALQPEARAVFLGDADQLPPVETGAVLRDLCRSGTAREKGRVVVLTKSYRAREEDPCGKKILDTAAAINEGRWPAGAGDLIAVRKEPAELRFEGVEHLAAATGEQAAAFFARWRELIHSGLPDLKARLAREYVLDAAGFDEETAGALRLLLAHYERCRLLCVTRVTAGGTGSEAANAWFHRQWCAEFKAAGGPAGDSYFQVGEPVLITRNDYNLRLFNGDAGLVLKVKAATETRQRAAEAMAVFPRGEGFVAFPLEALRGRLELAWAITVHKAQGSEYDHVAVLLPGIYVRPLTRELLYTAVTRARKSVTFVGSAEVLEAGVQLKIERDSGLADLLG